MRLAVLMSSWNGPFSDKDSSSSRQSLYPSPEWSANATTNESIMDRFPQVPTATQSSRPLAITIHSSSSLVARPRRMHSLTIRRSRGPVETLSYSESAFEWLPMAFWSSHDALRSNAVPFSSVITGMFPHTIASSRPSNFMKAPSSPSSLRLPPPPRGLVSLFCQVVASSSRARLGRTGRTVVVTCGGCQALPPPPPTAPGAATAPPPLSPMAVG
mmetsp:Transcript_68265/g.192462  ORF Transcript_68265/g.192462 Transcript_68265/m.192462 type:complete len:215 (+) Transcript_68265:170-814(+)